MRTSEKCYDLDRLDPSQSLTKYGVPEDSLKHLYDPSRNPILVIEAPALTLGQPSSWSRSPYEKGVHTYYYYGIRGIRV